MKKFKNVFLAFFVTALTSLNLVLPAYAEETTTPTVDSAGFSVSVVGDGTVTLSSGDFTKSLSNGDIFNADYEEGTEIKIVSKSNENAVIDDITLNDSTISGFSSGKKINKSASSVTEYDVIDYIQTLNTNKVEGAQADHQNLLEINDMMNREIELLDKKRVWKDYREMTSSERSRYFDTGMTVEYSNGKTTVIHCYGNEHLEGMRNGTLRMGVYAPEEMVLVPKSVVKELIDTHDQQYSLTKDTRLFVNMFNKLRGALSRIKERKNDDLER